MFKRCLVLLGVFTTLMLFSLTSVFAISDFNMEISDPNDASSSVMAKYDDSKKQIIISGHGQIVYAKWVEMAKKFGGSNFDNNANNRAWNGEEDFEIIFRGDSSEAIKLCNTGSNGGLFEGFDRDIYFDEKVDTSDVMDMSYMFCGAAHFCDYIGDWNTSKVTDMSYMFADASKFAGNISEWDTSKVTNMHKMFIGTSMKKIILLKRDGAHDTSVAFDGEEDIFSGTTPDEIKFKGMQSFKWTLPEDYKIKNVTKNTEQTKAQNDKYTFIANDEYEIIFTGTKRGYLNNSESVKYKYDSDDKALKIYGFGKIDYDKWELMVSRFESKMLDSEDRCSNWKGNQDFEIKFYKDDKGAIKLCDGDLFDSFDGEIKFYKNVDVSDVTYMDNMFAGATKFNDDISDWNVSHVEDMSYMFYGATSFNEDISKWNTSKVKNMTAMFNNAKSMEEIDLSNRNATDTLLHYANGEKRLFNDIKPNKIKFKGLESFEWTLTDDYKIKNVTKNTTEDKSKDDKYTFLANNEYLITKSSSSGSQNSNKIPVKFVVTPSDARIKVSGVGYGADYNLVAGDYRYEIRKSGYSTKRGEFTLHSNDNSKTITINLEKRKQSLNLSDVIIQKNNTTEVSGQVNLTNINGMPNDIENPSYTLGATTGDIGVIKSTALNGSVVHYTLNASRIGEINIPITIKSSNYRDEKIDIVISTTNLVVPNVSVENITKDYDGKPLERSEIKYTVTTSGAALEADVRIRSPKPEDIVNAGKYNVKVKIYPEDNKYEDVEKYIDVTINKIKPSGTIAFDKVNTTLKDANLRLGSIKVRGIVEWINDKDTKVEKDKEYEWLFTPKGDDEKNYTELSGKVKVYKELNNSSNSSNSSSSSSSSHHSSSSRRRKSSSRSSSSRSYKYSSSSKTSVKNSNVKSTKTKVSEQSVIVKNQIKQNIRPGYVIKNGVVESSVSKKEIDKAINNIKKAYNNSSATNVKVKLYVDGGISKDKKVDISIPRESIRNIYNLKKPILDIDVKDVARVNLNEKALYSLSTKAGQNIELKLDKNQRGINFEAMVDGKTIDSIKGEIKLEIPNVSNGQVLVITDKNGNLDIVKKAVVYGDKAYAVLNKFGNISVIDNSKNFDDVSKNAWYNHSVDFVTSRKLFNGVGNNDFAPNVPMSRGMLVQVLYSLDGDKSKTNYNYFNDINNSVWYKDSAAWANNNNLVSGYANGNFGGNDPVTREQLIKVLYQYAKYTGMDTSRTRNINHYKDGGYVSSYAVDSMKWAVGTGLVSGYSDNTLKPQGKATRAEVSALLTKFVSDLVNESGR